MLDGEFLGGDDAFGLVTDVEEDFVPIDLDDGAGDDVPVVERNDGGVNGREEVVAGANVIDCDSRCLSGALLHDLLH